MKWTWIGAQGVPPAAVLEALGLELAPDWAPGGWRDAEYMMRTFPDEWTIVISEARLKLHAALPAVAAVNEGVTIGCDATTVVMVSEVQVYENGQPVWSASHDPDDDMLNLDVQGEPPARLAELLSEAKAKTAESDEADFVFDVAMNLVAERTGFMAESDEHRDWIPLRKVKAQAVQGASSEGPLAALLRVFGLKR